jgi:hypothetical protein
MESIVDGANVLGDSIHQLILESRKENAYKRRSEGRYPLVRPVTINVDGRSLSALTREISVSGIGLQHDFELPLGEVQLTIFSDFGYTVLTQAKIIWCEPCGLGWYLSGGEFTALAGVRA